MARLVEVFREVRRVLRDDGTLWLNLGDTHNNRARIRKSSHQPSLHAFSEATWKDTAAKGGCRSLPTPCKVLDPFAGAGTTGFAALRLGRDAVLIELNSEYCKVMEQRLAGEGIGTFD